MDYNKIISESIKEVLIKGGDWRTDRFGVPKFNFYCDINYDRCYSSKKEVGKGAIYTLEVKIDDEGGLYAYNIEDTLLRDISDTICQKISISPSSIFAYHNFIQIIWVDDNAIALKNAEPSNPDTNNAEALYENRNQAVGEIMMLQMPRDTGFLAYKKKSNDNDILIDGYFEVEILSIDKDPKDNDIIIEFKPYKDDVYIEDTYQGDKWESFTVKYHWFENPRLRPL